MRRPVELSATRAPQPLPLVGRDRELALLREQLAAALAGEGSLVLIGGEAGIGKTALAEALAVEAMARGAVVLVGRCYDLAETPPYGPWAEALARAARPRPHGEYGRCPHEPGGALRRAARFPGCPRRPPAAGAPAR